MRPTLLLPTARAPADLGQLASHLPWPVPAMATVICFPQIVVSRPWCALNICYIERSGEKSMMRRTWTRNEAFLLRLSRGNAGGAGSRAPGGHVACCLSAVVAKVRPVNTA